MHDRRRRADAPGELTDAELSAERGATLPAREAMSTVGFDPAGWDNFAMPVNEALALNNESTDSVAFAEADQTVIIAPLSDAAPASDPTQEG
jgi:hypothetical protein